MATSTQWRLNISANNGGTWVYLAEISFRATAGGTMAAGTPSASSTYASSNPSYASDGNSSTIWFPNTVPTGWWLQTFDTAQSVVEYMVQCGPSAGDASTNSPKHWTLEYYDGAQWVTADSQLFQTWTAGESKTFTVNPAYATSGRVYQSVVEVLRLPTAPNLQLTASVLEVLRSNGVETFTPTLQRILSMEYAFGGQPFVFAGTPTTAGLDYAFGGQPHTNGYRIDYLYSPAEGLVFNFVDSSYVAPQGNGVLTYFGVTPDTVAAALASDMACSATLSATLETLAPAVLASGMSAQGSLTAALSTGIALASVLQSISNVSADLFTEVALQSSITGSAVSVAELSTQIALSTGIAAGADFATALDTGIPLSANLSATAQLAADLSTQVALASSMQGQAGVEATLTIPAVTDQLESASTATATMSCALSTGIALSAPLVSNATLTAALVTGIPLSCILQGNAACSASLSTTVALSSTLQGGSTSEAALSTEIALACALPVSCTLSASLSTSIALGSALSASCTSSTDLHTEIRMLAQLASSAMVAADLLTQITLHTAMYGAGSSTTDLVIPFKPPVFPNFVFPEQDRMLIVPECDRVMAYEQDRTLTL